MRSHKKATGYFISRDDYARVRQAIAASRRAYHPSELPEHLKAAIREARMSPEYDYLNAPLDEE